MASVIVRGGGSCITCFSCCWESSSEDEVSEVSEVRTDMERSRAADDEEVSEPMGEGERCGDREVDEGAERVEGVVSRKGPFIRALFTGKAEASPENMAGDSDAQNKLIDQSLLSARFCRLSFV